MIKTSMPVQPTSARRAPAPRISRGGSTIMSARPPERLVEARVVRQTSVPIGMGSNIVISDTGELSGRLHLPPNVSPKAIGSFSISSPL